MPKRLVILGTGFAAYSLVKALRSKDYDVTVISPRNHFLYTPLLPSTTVGTIEFRTIIEPIRQKARKCQFFQGLVTNIDLQNRTVACQSLDQQRHWHVPYDLLVIAVGCITNTFGIPGVKEHALFLKELADARRIRERLVENLEMASLPDISNQERQSLLHCIAVGAGPTGVRFAAELYDLLTEDIPKKYPHLASDIHVTLLEAGKSLLSAYDEKLREYVAQAFHRRGISVRTGQLVTAVGPNGVTLKGGEEVTSRLVLWCAGFARNPLIDSLDLEKDRLGRLITDDHLRIPSHPEVYAAGDCASPRDRNLPQLAQVAGQEGKYLADHFARLASNKSSKPFRWQNHGMSSYIGDGDAVVHSAEQGNQQAGFWAYQQWRTAMWNEMMSGRNKLIVPFDRLRSNWFGRDLSKFG